MARILNKGLFETATPIKPTAPTPQPEHSMGSTWSQAQMHESGPSRDYVPMEEFKILLGQLEHMKRRVKETEAKMDMLTSRVSELVGGIKMKFEKANGGQSRFEDYVRQALHDLAEKYSQMAGKISEKKMSDSKIQEMIDRHNQMVHNFDVRLNQLQKVISEQELQLMTSRAELKEAQRELARNRRPLGLS